jgi:hypothetical protein
MKRSVSFSAIKNAVTMEQALTLRDSSEKRRDWIPSAVNAHSQRMNQTRFIVFQSIHGAVYGRVTPNLASGIGEAASEGTFWIL